MKSSRKKLIGFSLLPLLGVATIGLLSSQLNEISFSLIRGDIYSNYSLTLNSSNKVTTSGDHVAHTDQHQNNVTFTYGENLASSTSGHVTLNDGGYFVNKDHIRSIESIACTTNVESVLSFKVSYDGATWGASTTVISGTKYELASNPYYVRFDASATVTVQSVVIEYSCSENPNAHEGETAGEDVTYYQKVENSASFTGDCLIVYEEGGVAFDGSLTSLDATSNYVAVTISEGVIEYTTALGASEFNINASGHILSKSGYYIGNTSNDNALKTSTETQYTNSVSVSSGDAAIVSAGTYLRYNAVDNQKRFRYYKSTSYTNQQPVAIYEKVTEAGAIHYDTPVDCVGFSATHSHTSSDSFGSYDYFTTETFNPNSLSVVANMNDGSHVDLASNQYTYVITKGGVVIDHTKAFGTVGDYVLTVSYKNYIPQEITLHVGNHKYLTAITINSSKLTYNTADTLDKTAISGSLTYNTNESEADLSYDALIAKGVTINLVNPSSVNYDINAVFGTAGTWKIVATKDEAYSEVSLTVNAIPVTTISVTSSEGASVEEGKTLQLTLSVGPNNATNQNVTWTSSNEAIATVNNTGLVTAKTPGQVTIRATAQDGSAVYGEITITVTEKVAGADEGTFTLSSGSLTVGSYVIFANPVSNGNGYAMAEQRTNNRGAVSATFDNGSIERESTSTFKAFLVGEGTTDGTYSFYDAEQDGYLCAASSGSNLLHTETTLTANSSFAVTGSTEKTITAQGNYTRNLLRFNSNNTIFSCYGSGQANPYIYEKAGDPVYPTAISVTGTQAIGVGETSQLTVSFTPANTSVKAVSYESSNDLVATVSSTGLVTGVKAGSTTITVTGHNNIQATIGITVSNISVTSVTLNKTSTSITAGATETLVATVNPNNATNKEIIWSTSDNSVATVDEGVVTAVSAGSATITATSAENADKKATCTVTVTASGGQAQANSVSFTFTDKDWGTSTTDWNCGASGAGYLNSGVQVTSTASGANATSPTSYECVQSVVVTYCTNASKGAGSIEIRVGSTVLDEEKSVSTSGGTTGRDMTFTGDGTLTGAVKITVTCSTNSIYILAITINYGTSTPTDPTSISLNKNALSLSAGGSETLSVSYLPAAANQNKAVTWTSSNESVATVDTSGKVTVKSTATVNQTATITAKLTNLPSITATCTVTVVEKAAANQTILVYICGSNLESDYASKNQGLATGDIQEILSVSGQPSDVNIVIETGGATNWSSRYGISSTYLQRYHVNNQSLDLDNSYDYASMGLSSTLQSFVEYGLTNYEADRTGLILWNHGGAMRGVCYDEKKNDDCLTDNEVKSAVTGALNNAGKSGQKLEWIGYDACLMQVQDIAEMNSAYANYMIASEESESGYGWDYDTWVDNLYAKDTTPNILKAIVDGFISENGGTSSSSNDQTLSYLDLSYASAYKTAWENMASQLSSKLQSGGKSAFKDLVTSCKYYAEDDYDYYGIFDAKDFINKLSNNSTFNPGSTYTSAVLTAHGNLVAYSKCGKGAGNSNGLAMFWPVSSYCAKGTYYTSSMTNFSTWRSLASSYGY